MRKVIVAVLVMLFWCNVGFADLKVLNKYSEGKEKEIRDMDRQYLSFSVYVVCVDGLKFLMAKDLRSDVVDTTQMIGKDGKPETCSTN
jgi:hypothetical protein